MNKRIVSFFFFFSVSFVVLYFYYLHWETKTIYGDDLLAYKNHASALFTDKIDLDIISKKYRPIHGLLMHWSIVLFDKNLHSYYCLNVLIQAINASIFAMIANMIVRSEFLSFLFGIAVGLSRFSYYNISQLYNGGTLEGIALSFFLLFLLAYLKLFYDNGKNNIGLVLWCILFANLCLYTHERYIVLLPAIVLSIFSSTKLNSIPINKKVGLTALTLLSVISNVVIKTKLLHLPFFLGTSNANITFSFSTTISFLKDAALSLIQLNTGPEFTSGIQFRSLHLVDKLSAIIVATTVLYLLCRAIFRSFTANSIQSNSQSIWTKISLYILFALLLIPAVTTIRLEQRWLQAPFSVLIFLLILAIEELPQTKKQNSYLYFLLPLMLIWVNYRYFDLGVNNYFMNQAENTAAKFKKAIENGTIRPETDDLYVLNYVDKENNNAKEPLLWYLANGYFFDYYQGKSKAIKFIDSTEVLSTVRSHNADIQIISIADSIVAIP